MFTMVHQAKNAYQKAISFAAIVIFLVFLTASVHSEESESLEAQEDFYVDIDRGF